ncbi:MAG: hypothetical protein WD271_08625 [Acidimicrobiia bacterium]
MHEDPPPTDAADDDALAGRTASQLAYLRRLVYRADVAVLTSDEMWR